MGPQRVEKIIKVLHNRQPDLALIMENVNDPHNISAVMRTADAVGVQEIFVLNTTIAQHKRFGKKSSSSAAEWLTVQQFDNTHACITEVRKRFNKIYATHLGLASKSLYDLDLTESVALVFGNEHSGVSDECLKYCDGNFVIPQVGMIQSLNISVACAVALYEAFRQRQSVGYYNGIPRMQTEQIVSLSRRWKLYDYQEQQNQ